MNRSLLETKVIGKRHTLKRITMSLQLQDQREIQKKFGANAVLLIQFMYSKAGAPKYEFTDKKTGEALGWSTQTAQRTRLALEKGGWLFSRRYTASDKHKHITYYIGPNVVEETTRAILETDMTLESGNQ